jgi:quercetin dioxygenase-like cupin family protein
LLPQAHAPSSEPAPQPDLDGLPKKIAAYTRAVRAAAAQGGDWRGTIGALRASTPALWEGLSLSERARFLRRVRPYWDVHRHRAAPATAEAIANLIAQGALRGAACAAAPPLMEARRQGDFAVVSGPQEEPMSKTKLTTVGVVLAGLAMVAPVLSAQEVKAGKAVVWPAAGLTWTDAVNAPPGVKQAVLWGDPATGAFGTMMKFPAGFTAALHWHTANLRMVVVSGTVIHGPEGKPEVRLTAGSFLAEPSGYKHTTACDKASECVFFMEGDGKFDLLGLVKK